jgi:hypothetical protein
LAVFISFLILCVSSLRQSLRQTAAASFGICAHPVEDHLNPKQTE